jgi:hypothetical protein
MLARSLEHREDEMISEKATSSASCSMMRRDGERRIQGHMGMLGGTLEGFAGPFVLLCS